jgi:hypothetical protein
MILEFLVIFLIIIVWLKELFPLFKENKKLGIFCLVFSVMHILLFYSMTLLAESEYMRVLIMAILIVPTLMYFILSCTYRRYNLKMKLFPSMILSMMSMFCLFIIFTLGFGSTNSTDDAKIKADMDQIRSDAEVYKITNNAYALNIISIKGQCDISDSFLYVEGDANKACESIQKGKNRGELIININNLKEGDAKYCIQKELHSGFFCIDSTGYAGNKDGCDSVNYSCEKD